MYFLPLLWYGVPLPTAIINHSTFRVTESILCIPQRQKCIVQLCLDRQMTLRSELVQYRLWSLHGHTLLKIVRLMIPVMVHQYFELHVNNKYTHTHILITVPRQQCCVTRTLSVFFSYVSLLRSVFLFYLFLGLSKSKRVFVWHMLHPIHFHFCNLICAATGFPCGRVRCS